MPLTLGVPTETAAAKRRVALAPDAVRRLVRSSGHVVIEGGAETSAFLPDATYVESGTDVADRASALAADVIATVAGLDDLAGVRPGAAVNGLLVPLDRSQDAEWHAAGVTTVAAELIPRASRAQRMDALSAMSTVAGCKAAVRAAATVLTFSPFSRRLLEQCAWPACSSSVPA